MTTLTEPQLLEPALLFDPQPSEPDFMTNYGSGGFEFPYDRGPVAGTSLADLDVERFQREYVPSINQRRDSTAYRRVENRSVEEQLSIAKMIVSVDQPEATVAGILTYGNQPQHFFPNAYLQFRRIDGIEFTCNIMESAYIFGTIQDQIDEIVKKFSSVFQGRKGEVFCEALRYIVDNAVAHKNYESYFPVFVDWYNDRVEILSPGGLFGCLSAKTFRQFSLGLIDYRNPNLADILQTLGYIEKFGRGRILAKNKLQTIGLSLNWSIDVSYVRVTISTE